MHHIDAEDGGSVLEATPNRSFVFQWSPGQHPTTVSFTLREHKNGTILRVEETGYSTTREDLSACLDCAAGWGEALTLFKIYLEHSITYKVVP